MDFYENAVGMQRNNIYINSNFNQHNTKVLVNPNFNIRPHINPNFKCVRNQNIYVNPTIFHQKHATKEYPNISTNSNEVNTSTIPEKNLIKNVNYVTNHKTIISTRNKLIRKHTIEEEVLTNTSILASKYKLVRVNVSKDTVHLTNVAAVPSANKLKVDHREQNKCTKFNLDRDSKNNKIHRLKLDHRNINKCNRLKIDNRNINKCNRLKIDNRNINKCSRLKIDNRNINKYNRLKIDNRNTTKIMHTSKYKFKKASLLNLDLQHQVIKSSRRKFSNNKSFMTNKLIIRTGSKKYLNLCDNKLAKSYARNKVKINSKMLKKDNNPCLTYVTTGICEKHNKDLCTRMHNPNQINMCPRFLQGACHTDKCLLSHLISPQKMPTCKFYLEGICTKDNCSYTHIKLNKNSDICRQFLSGYCGRGVHCFKRHQFLCPMFEKYKACHNKQCHYPHGYSESNYKNNIVNKIARGTYKVMFPRSKEHVKLKQAKTGDKGKKDITKNNTQIENIRYYQGENEKGNENNANVETLVRPKLGNLPSFIPFS